MSFYWGKKQEEEEEEHTHTHTHTHKLGMGVNFQQTNLPKKQNHSCLTVFIFVARLFTLL